MEELCRELKRSLRAKGACLVGFADLIEVPAEVRDSMRFAVSMAVALDAAAISTIRDGPTHPYYVEYRKANRNRHPMNNS